MAISYSAVTAGTVYGNERVTFGIVTTGATTATTACGLSYVKFAMVGPATATTAAWAFNVTSGQVNITSAVAGDTYNVIAFGK